VQLLPSSQSGGVAAAQVPARQVSAPLQKLPSSHDVPSAAGAWLQPPAASQVSTVHGLWSSQSIGWDATQLPPWQLSLPLQALPSPHGVPSARGLVKQPSAASSQLPVWHAPVEDS